MKTKINTGELSAIMTAINEIWPIPNNIELVAGEEYRIQIEYALKEYDLFFLNKLESQEKSKRLISLKKCLLVLLNDKRLNLELFLDTLSGYSSEIESENCRDLKVIWEHYFKGENYESSEINEYGYEFIDNIGRVLKM